MPPKKIHQPRFLRNEEKRLLNTYGPNVMDFAAQIYSFFYVIPDSMRLKCYSWVKKHHSNVFPKNGLPCSGKSKWEIKMSYVQQLNFMLKQLGIKVAKAKKLAKPKQVRHTRIDDMVILIYITYFTGFMYNSLKDLDMADLQLVSNNPFVPKSPPDREEDIPFTSPLFHQHFSGVDRYSFTKSKGTAPQNEVKFKQSLHDAMRDFKNQFPSEKVELALFLAMCHGAYGDITIRQALEFRHIKLKRKRSS